MFGPIDPQHGNGWTLYHSDCVAQMRAMPENSVDCIVTDPPYHLTSIQKRYGGTDIGRDGTNETRARNRSDAMGRLAGGFMGKSWDGGDVAFRVETWQAAIRVLKPGGYIFAFASTRGYHRMACAIEDAGFITHPMIGWCFGSGFPKATNAGRMIDKALGAVREVTREGVVKRDGYGDDWDTGSSETRPRYDKPVTPEAAEWDGWYYGGQVRKPALEPIYVGQKPFSEKNGALNILRWGVGAVNIDGCRVGMSGDDHAILNLKSSKNPTGNAAANVPFVEGVASKPHDLGRWPANLMHDGSPEVLALFPHTKSNSGNLTHKKGVQGVAYGKYGATPTKGITDEGSAARFFNCYPPDVLPLIYCSKANKADRAGSRHPTVKPQKLMRDIIKHGTPPGCTVLDPFAGTGSTLQAAIAEGRNAIGIEADVTSILDTVRRLRQ